MVTSLNNGEVHGVRTVEGPTDGQGYGAGSGNGWGGIGVVLLEIVD